MILIPKAVQISPRAARVRRLLGAIFVVGDDGLVAGGGCVEREEPRASDAVMFLSTTIDIGNCVFVDFEPDGVGCSENLRSDEMNRLDHSALLTNYTYDQSLLEFAR